MDLVSLLTSTTSKGNPNAWDISKAYYDAGADAWDVSKTLPQNSNLSFAIGGEFPFASDLFFKPDGTKAYVIDSGSSGGDVINEYTLSTPWSASTASYVQNFSVATEEINPTGLFFKPDGTKMYVCGSSGDDVNEYDLSTAWDISTASYVQNFSVATEELIPQSLSFKPDGTKMYVLGATGDDVNEYGLSSAWDISTASYVQSFSVAGQETAPTGLFFKPDGTKMYICGTAGDDLNEYDLSTAWDISTASYVQVFDIGADGLPSNPNGVFFDNSGSYFYVCGQNADSTSQRVWQRVLDGGFSVAAQEALPQGLFFKPDGTKMYVTGTTGDDVNEYDLSNAWDVTTASYLQVFSVAGQETNPRNLFFKPDGTKMYIVGSTGDDVNEYDLSTPWDISTASYLQNFSVSAQEAAPTGLFFKPDGTKMYVCGSSGDDVNEYDLSTAWDISSASYVRNFSVSAQETAPESIAFKPDGTKMYILGSFGDDINEYSLSTPWDISTASYVQSFSVAGQETTPTGLFFKPDGTQFWIIGSGNDAVFSYKISPE